MQILQDIQVILSNCGLSHRDLFIIAQGMPKGSFTASTGQIRPQAPHSMHRSVAIT